MTGAFSKFTSVERRFFLVLCVVVFVILNFVLVVPRFKERHAVMNRMAGATSKLESFKKAIATSTNLEREVKELEKTGENTVPDEDRGADFIRTIQNAAAQSGVNIQSMQRSTTRTNDQFFIEQGQSARLTSNETNLVQFLYLLSSGNSLVTVRDLVMRPDQPRFLLSAELKLVASYQKKAPVKPGTPATAPAAAATSSTRNRP
jgi:Tfp pilus assembly protein PilO